MAGNGRHEVLISGLGGQGVVTMARLLVEASLENYPHAFFFPSYSTEQRGGSVQCSVVLAKSLEDSQPRLYPDAAILFTASGLPEIKQRLSKGGKLFVESSIWPKDTKKEGSQPFVKLYLIPAIEKAHELGSMQVANLILLGAYLAETGALPLWKIEAALEKRMGERKKTALLELNKKALHIGASMIS